MAKLFERTKTYLTILLLSAAPAALSQQRSLRDATVTDQGSTRSDFRIIEQYKPQARVQSYPQKSDTLYCSALNRVNMWDMPADTLTLAQAKVLPAGYFRLTMDDGKGRWLRFEHFVGDRLTPIGRNLVYLGAVASDLHSPFANEAQWDVLSDASDMHPVQFICYDTDDTPLYRTLLGYTPDGRVYLTFADALGLPRSFSLGTVTVGAIQISFDDQGRESFLQFFDSNGTPTTDLDGRYFIIYDYSVSPAGRIACRYDHKPLEP